MSGRREIISSILLVGIVASPISVSFGARPTSSIMTAGSYVDAALHEDGIVAANRWGVEFFEINVDGYLRSISRAHTVGRAEFLDVKGDLVAVSDFNGSLEFFLIENRTFSRAGWLKLDFHPLELKIVGEYLYVGGLERSLVVYDISNPGHPVEINQVVFTGYPHDFKIRNDSMFVAAYHGGVVILDISDRADPVKIEQYFMPDFVYSVEIESSYVYVCAHQSGLYVLDLRFNGRPPVIGHNPSFGSAREARIVDSGLLALDAFGGMKLIDLTSRSQPEIIWEIPLDFNCYNLEIVNDMVFVANWIHGVKTIRLRGKNGCEIVDSIENYALCKSIALDNDRILAAAGNGGLLTLGMDLKPISTPGLHVEGSCLEIKISGNLGFISTDERGLSVIDLKENGEIINVSDLKTNGWVKSSVYDGRYAYLANWQGVVTVDLEDITAPIEGGFYDTFYGSSKIEQRNDTVFVAGSGGLELYDVSDPNNVGFLARFFTEFPSMDLSFDGDLVVLSGGWGGVEIISLSDGLESISHITTGGKAYDSHLIGNKLFVAEGDSGISVWDVSVLEEPEYLLGLDVAGKACDMVFSGKRIYVADDYGITMLELPWEDVYYGGDADPEREPNQSLRLYPNPILQKASLTFDTGSPGNIDVELYDILGRKVRTLFRGYSRGITQVSWDNYDLPTGCYFVRVRGNGFVETRQITLLK